MKSIQVNSNIPNSLVKEIDRLVKKFNYRSRSHFIQSAIEKLVIEQKNFSMGIMPPVKTKRKN